MYKYEAICARVVDGDTIDCLIDLGFSIHIKQRVRLLDIDAPESRTSDPVEKVEGLKVKKWLKDRIEGQTVILHTEYDSRGKFGRVLATIYHEGVNLNQLMLKEGLADPYGR